MMVRTRQNIPLTEIWSRTSWTNWDTEISFTSGIALGRQPSTGYTFSVGGQQHIMLRNFVEPQGWLASGSGRITANGALAAFNHWPGMTVSLTAGLTTLSSNYLTAVDLTPVANGTLTLALPNYPASGIDLTNSFVDLFSSGVGLNPANTLAPSSGLIPMASTICSLPWSQSTTPPTGSFTTLSWPSSMLNGINLAQISGVRIRITATSSVTINLMALRLIGSAWSQTNVDFDNIAGQLRQCIPLTGNPASVPVANNQTLPILYRSASVPGIDDPRPINSEISYMFNTGSQTSANSFDLYMREVSQAFITQLDLQGTSQASLNNNPQPALGVSTLAPRTMADLDGSTMSTLDSQQMTNLESVNSLVSSSWIRFRVTWGPNPSVQITNSTQPNGGYKFTSGLNFANNITYLAICRLTDTSAQLQIYNANQTTLALGALLFDTTVIPDSFMFSRRAGRIGFQATLQDGDTYIGPIRPRNVSFAEYRSRALNSVTPVRGAQLYVQDSPDIELFSNWSPLPDIHGNTPTLVADQQRFVRTHSDFASTRVSITTPGSAQGVISNWLSPVNDAISGITDFEQLHIGFALWMPSGVTTPGNFTASLISSSGAVLPLNLPPLTPNQWQSFVLYRPFPQPYPQSGLYQLAFNYSGSAGVTFWIDDVTVHEHAIAWEARSVIDDPWSSNFAPWTPFHDALNSDTSGAYFSTQGTQMQMRAKARKQDAAILSPPKLVPVYAELGRLVWPEDALSASVAPTAVISTTANGGRSYTFNGSSSSGPNSVYAYQWAFGDGAFGSGVVTQHTFPSWVPAGTAYTVTLTVFDRLGNQGQQTVVITL